MSNQFSIFNPVPSAPPLDLEVAEEINAITSNNPTNSKVESISSKIVKVEDSSSQLSWHERTIAQLNSWDKQLDEAMPNNTIQNKIDEIRSHLEKTFAPLTEFNKWLDSNGHGDWHLQLATFLAKLPIRAVRNVVQLIYGIINEIFYLAAHPLKGVNHLAKLLVSLAKALTQPETWPKIGSGMIGTLFGQSCITGNPLSIIGMGIGAAMTVAGLSISFLKTTKSNGILKAIRQNLSQLSKLPEYLLTGFLVGLLIGAIQRAMQSNKPEKLREHKAQLQSSPINNYQDAQAYADKFIKKYNFPEYSSVTLDPSGTITLEWDNVDAFMNQHPYFFKGVKPNFYETEIPISLKMDIHCRVPVAQIEFFGIDGHWEGDYYTTQVSLEDFIDTRDWTNISKAPLKAS